MYFHLHNILAVLQRSQGNGPLNRLLMAAKRKYMDTELPPQESEGKVTSTFRKLAVAFAQAADRSGNLSSARAEAFSDGGTDPSKEWVPLSALFQGVIFSTHLSQPKAFADLA